MRPLFVLFGLLAAVPARAACGEADTAFDSDAVDDDCDSDGWTKGQGDCDDERATANPGRGEDCAVRGDDDCDGLVDEGCVDPLLGATLQGGSSCGTAGGAGVAGVLVVALVARRRRG